MTRSRKKASGRGRQKQQRGHKVELLLSVSNRLLLGSGWAGDGSVLKVLMTDFNGVY